MFIVESSFPVLISLIIQLCLVPFQVINYLARKSDPMRLRFLVLLCLFIVVNAGSLILGIENYAVFGDNNLFPILIVVVLPLIYIRYYICTELSLSSNRSNSFNIVFLASLFVVSFQLIAGIFQFDTDRYAWICILPLEIVLFVFNRKLLIKIIDLKITSSSIYFSAIFSLVCLILLPAILIGFHSVWLESLAFNMAFFALGYSYFVKFYQTAKSETEILESLKAKSEESLITSQNITNVLSDADLALTAREVEIIEHLIKGLSYNEIADKFYMTSGGVRTHASNIFTKIGVANIKEFRQKYSSLQNE